ncbi:MAG: helix-turn-helix domain-containing protein [Streptosporangiales bacterium]|nr:helix-turn-helix domain-containing protein [Streptosporangiales bacterium]
MPADHAETDLDTAALLPLMILETVLSSQDSWGVTELAHELGLPKARVHRHLAKLRQGGYLAQHPDTRRYEPGWRLVLLGQRIQGRAPLVTLAQPVMARLRDAVRQTIVLSQLTDTGVTVTEVLPGGSPIDVVLKPGTQFMYNSSAQGKVALAFGTPEQVANWGALIDEERTPETITDPAELWAQVDEVRTNGWATGPEETYRGINAVAAPVLTHDGTLAATLAIVASIHYLPAPPPNDAVELLTAAARDLSSDLGFGRGDRTRTSTEGHAHANLAADAGPRT